MLEVATDLTLEEYALIKAIRDITVRPEDVLITLLDRFEQGDSEYKRIEAYVQKVFS